MTFKLSVWIEGFIKADKESFFLPFLTNLFHSGGSESINATGRQHAERFSLIAFNFSRGDRETILRESHLQHIER